MKNYMKKALSVFATALFAISVSACGHSSSTDGNAASSGSGQLKTVAVSTNPFIGNGALYVAMDQGFFEKHGLKVELKEFDSPSQSVAALMAGQVQVTIGTLDSQMIAADQNQNAISVIGVQDSSAGADGILAKSGIASIADLKGKTIGAPKGETSGLLLEYALQKNNMTIKDVTLQDMGASDAGAAFMAGKLDAAVTWEPYLSNAKKSNAGSIIFSSADAPNVIADVIVVSKKEASKTDNEWISAYLDAIQDGLDYINDPKTEAQAFQIIAAQLGISADEAKAQYKGVKTFSKGDMKKALENGGAIETTMDFVNKIYVGNGLIHTAITPKDLLNASFIR